MFDGHSLVYGILKVKCPRASPVDIEHRSFIEYGSFKNFKTDDFLWDLQGVPFQVATVFDDPSDSELLRDVLIGQAPSARALEINNQLSQS